MANLNDQTSSPLATLAMARAAQRLAKRHSDPDLQKFALKVENEALAELKAGKAPPPQPR